MKRYGRWFVAAILGVLSVVGGLNLILDANRLYRTRDPALRSLVISYVDRLLISSDGLIQFLYERPFKNELARRAPAECAVTGSSHEMQFGLNNFPPARGCRSLVNLAVSGGSFEEFLISASILDRRGETEKIFVGIGPWMFRREASARWIEFPDEYEVALQHFGLNQRSIWSSMIVKISNLFNLQYLWVGIENAFQPRQRLGTVRAFDAIGRGPADAVTRRDGTLIYSNEYEEQSARNSIGRGTYMLDEPPISLQVFKEFRAVLNQLKEKGITLVLVLTPYHPQVFLCASELACRTLKEVEEAVRKLSTEMSIEVVGSYNPARFGLVAQDFYDEMHLKEFAIRKLTKLPAM